jgi:hypothetical protein
MIVSDPDHTGRLAMLHHQGVEIGLETFASGSMNIHPDRL